MKNTRNFLIWAIIILLLFGAFGQSGGVSNQNKELGRRISFTQFMKHVKAGEVASVTFRKDNFIIGDFISPDVQTIELSKEEQSGKIAQTPKDEEIRISGHLAKWIERQRGENVVENTTRFSLYVPADDPQLVADLQKDGVKIVVAPPESNQPGMWDYVLLLAPWLFFGLIFWALFVRSSGGGGVGGGKVFGFGKIKARLIDGKSNKITFKDVAGIDEAKKELEEVVDFLRDPRKFERLGGRIPKGVLLVGPPGTGKTLLAKAIAGEASVPFFSISGSDFVEMFVGVGASRVRDMFEQGKKSAPCIMFIDEIDAVGRHRGSGHGGGNDEREQTLNQLLVEMDGFEPNLGVIIIAATNRPDVLDNALLRPGRFDRQVTIDLPDMKGREEVLAVHIKKVPVASDVDLNLLARGTPGFSGADMANLVNEAALMAARKNKRLVSIKDFEAAKDKIIMGTKRSRIMTDDERKTTAYHEAGHTIVSISLPETEPIHKVTITPHGMALGLTVSLPERDFVSESKTKLISRMATLAAGRVAEEILLGSDKITTGAVNDIQRLTKIARAMVMRLGMIDELGIVDYETLSGQNESYNIIKGISDSTAQKIDEYVRRLAEGARSTAWKILEDKRKQLDALSNALLEYEVLSGDDVKEIMAGNEPQRRKASTEKNEIKATIPIDDFGQKQTVK